MVMSDEQPGAPDTVRTDPDNAAVTCGSHNRLEHRGRFRAFRRSDGERLILDGDNEPVG